MRISVRMCLLLVSLLSMLLSCKSDPYIYITFDATPNPIAKGDSATLRWNVTGADKVTIDNGIGEVPPYGKYVVSPGQSQKYTLTATNSGRRAEENVIVNIIEGATAPAPKPAPNENKSEVNIATNPALPLAEKTHGFVFSSFDGIWDIYYMHEDGTGRIKLTKQTKNNMEPAWSPDTAKIAFISDRDGENQLYVMNVDGTNVIKLTDMLGVHSPNWSPDSKKIAFVSEEQWGIENYAKPWYLSNDIYIIDCDGKNLTKITGALQEFVESISAEPAWSPNGKRLLFLNAKFGKRYGYGSSNQELPTAFNEKYPQIYAYDFESNSIVNVTNSEKDTNISHTWSPDGNTIVFYSNREDSEPMTDIWKVFTVGSDGKGIEKLSDITLIGYGGPSRNYPAAGGTSGHWWTLFQPFIHWSPDGNKIVFMFSHVSEGYSNQKISRNWDIIIANSDGSDPINTGKYIYDCRQICWSPDSKYIAYVPPSNRTNNEYIPQFDNLNIMDVATKEITAIVDCKVYSYLTWR